MRWRIDRLLYRKDQSLAAKILLFPLCLLSFLYEGAVRLRVFLYSLGFLNPKRLPCPVISVGNITVGGTGKTPLVMALARRLTEKGFPIAILSRGYKGKATSGPLVSNGQTIFLSSEESGDEPLLMAKTLKGTPVLVGKDRFINGQFAYQQFGVRGLLLDDGYQHLRLHRDLNILLIDSRVGFGDRHLLPRGILREPLTHLRRAHLFLLTKMEHPGETQTLEKILQEIHPSAPIFHSRYEPLGLIGPGGEWEEIGAFQGKKVLALSGIANPDYFSALLRKCGMEVEREEVFPDHHLYRAKDWIAIEQKSKGLDWVVTTEKDMLKLLHLDIHHFNIRALRIDIKVLEEEEFYKKMIDLFSDRGTE